MKLFESLHFCGSFFCKRVDTFSPTLITLLAFSLHLLVHTYFRNSTWYDTYLITFKRGMFTRSLQKVSRIVFSYSSFLDFANKQGKGKEERLEEIRTLEVILDAKVVSIENMASSFSKAKFPCCFVSSMVALTLFCASSSYFLLLNVIALAFLLRLIMV